jgi:purine nucleoside phosphorylase
MHPSFVPYRVAGAYVAKRIQDAGMESPEVGVICGSGLSELSEALEGVNLTVSRQYIGPTLRFAS